MPKLDLTDEQVVALVDQLPRHQKEALFKTLVRQVWGAWADLSGHGAEGARRAASERGREWDTITDEQREALIDEVVHEERGCRA